MGNNPYGARPVNRAQEVLDLFLNPSPELKMKFLRRIVEDPAFPDFLRENILSRAEEAIRENRGLTEFLIAALRIGEIPQETELRELPPDVREKLRSMIPPAKSKPRERGRPRKDRADLRYAVLALRAFGYSERKAAELVGDYVSLSPETVRTILKREVKK